MKNIQISHLIKRISLNIQQQMRNFHKHYLLRVKNFLSTSV